ncbi:MAG: class I SAM-dependent methyltransferase, partial [Acidobacteriota bacterium]
YARDEALHRRNARDRLGRIAPHRDRPGSLIDVGCAAGFFLDEAHRAGWRVTGIDVSSWARRVAQERFDLPVVTDLASLPVDPTPVDLVTFFQSLEHMADPRAAVEQAAGRLAVDGLVVIETWDRSSWLARRSGRSWQQVTPPSVLYLFSRKSLHRLLTDVGLEPVSMAATSKRVSVGLVAGILEYKRPALFGPLRRLLVKLAADRLSLRYRLGDLVTVVARKSV